MVGFEPCDDEFSVERLSIRELVERYDSEGIICWYGINKKFVRACKKLLKEEKNLDTRERPITKEAKDKFGMFMFDLEDLEPVDKPIGQVTILFTDYLQSIHLLKNDYFRRLFTQIAVEDSLSEADDEMDRALKQAEMNYETLGKDYLKKIQKQRLGASVIKIDKSNPLDVLKYLQHGYDLFAVDTCMIGFTEITSPIIKWENILGFGNPQ